MDTILPDQNVQQLILDARKGEREAISQLVEGLVPIVRQMCQTVFPDLLAAKAAKSDLVQEALLGASLNFHKFQGTREADLLAWVRSIVENKSQDLKRRFFQAEKRDVTLERTAISDEPDRQANLLADSTQSPLDKLIKVEEMAKVRQLVAGLPPHYREVVQLRHRNGMTFQEIADQLGRTEPSVKNIYVRALEILERNLLQ